MKIAVLGAGVVGLSTALQLQTAFPTHHHTIIAQHFYKETTSFGAAGFFRPSLEKTPGVDLEELRSISKTSWDHFDSLIHTTEASEAGVQALSGYQFTNNPTPNPIEEELCYHYRALTQKELDTFPGEKYKYGWFSTSILVEPGRYLPHLLKKFREQNGTEIKREIKSFEELLGQYDMVVNCLGLGNQSVNNDEKMYPERGQLVKVKAPWLKHFVYAGESACCYILPGIDLVSIGGTRTAHDYCLEVRKEDTEEIMRKACEVVPSLKNAEVLYEWVGLRPSRTPLRLEGEVVSFEGGNIRMIHNYGHGANGISLSWGSGVVVVKLAKEMMKDMSSVGCGENEVKC